MLHTFLKLKLFLNFYAFPLFFFTCLLFLGILNIIFNSKNIITIFIIIEFCLLCLNLLFVFGSFFIDDAMGLVFAILLLVIAAAEAAIGLSILILYYRVRANIYLNNKNFLRR